MSATAKVSRIALYIFLINVAVVIGVAGFKQATAQLDDPGASSELLTTNPPDVQIPSDPASDPPSLPVPAALGVPAVPPANALPLSAELSDPAQFSNNQLSAEIEPAPARGRADNMVMEEILKAIRDGRQDLEVPPLSFPAIPGLPKNAPVDLPPSLAPAGSTTSSNPNLAYAQAASPLATATTQVIEQRLKTIAALTQSAQSLVKESQLLQSLGRVAEAEQLLQNARIIQTMIARLAQET